ncbi:hypothetical protein llap_2422 [Limosa lapponica baueri]|uniref:Uncharacterized protein n=1 Tax=Limosa lapponica baueri TaxID=1758121 RepID=A0A2I0UMG3_LIMLA|nr:hypothetical protein llap_2422 [Limosa lapponica baueri]
MAFAAEGLLGFYDHQSRAVPYYGIDMLTLLLGKSALPLSFIPQRKGEERRGEERRGEERRGEERRGKGKAADCSYSGSKEEEFQGNFGAGEALVVTMVVMDKEQ